LLFRTRARGDELELVVHEPGLEFGEGSWRQSAVAAVHRVMTLLLLAGATRVWMSIAGWEKYLRPYALGRRIPFKWLPVPSSIPPSASVAADVATKRRRSECGGGPIVGHFGTYGRHVSELLEQMIPEMFQKKS